MNAITDHKVARMETWGGKVPVVVGWEIRGECGCYVLEGMRLDRNEIVLGFYGCDEHQEEMALLEKWYRNDAVAMAEGLAVDDAPRPLHIVLMERVNELIG